MTPARVLLLRPSGPAPEEDHRRLQAAADEHRPVLDLFRNATPVTTRPA